MESVEDFLLHRIRTERSRDKALHIVRELADFLEEKEKHNDRPANL